MALLWSTKFFCGMMYLEFYCQKNVILNLEEIRTADLHHNNVVSPNLTSKHIYTKWGWHLCLSGRVLRKIIVGLEKFKAIMHIKNNWNPGLCELVAVDIPRQRQGHLRKGKLHWFLSRRQHLGLHSFEHIDIKILNTVYVFHHPHHLAGIPHSL